MCTQNKVLRIILSVTSDDVVNICVFFGRHLDNEYEVYVTSGTYDIHYTSLYMYSTYWFLMIVSFVFNLKSKYATFKVTSPKVFFI